MSPDSAAAAFWAAFIRNRNVDERTADDGALPVAGGYALYVAGTAFDHVLGAGRDRPLRPDDFAVVEEFYTARGIAPSFNLDTESAERDAALLAERGYRTDPASTLVVYERPVQALLPLAAERSVVVRVTRDRRAWSTLMAQAQSDGAADDALRRTLRFLAAGASVLTIASLDGRDVGGGGILLAGELALFVSGGVLPEVRRRGVHAALVAARLEIAHERGATRAAVKTRLGSPVERTAQRAGFARSALSVTATRG
jgi:GNAT superfamily N-acetyltransferase